METAPAHHSAIHLSSYEQLSHPDHKIVYVHVPPAQHKPVEETHCCFFFPFKTGMAIWLICDIIAVGICFFEMYKMHSLEAELIDFDPKLVDTFNALIEELIIVSVLKALAIGCLYRGLTNINTAPGRYHFVQASQLYMLSELLVGALACSHFIGGSRDNDQEKMDPALI